MKDAEVAWVAGLLEGEGCFYIAFSPHPRVQVRCSMTDEDVILHLQRVTGRGKVRGPFTFKAYPDAKPQWLWTLGRKDGLDEFLRELLPWMGARRSAKITEILDALDEWPPRRLPEHGTRQMYEKHGCRCGECRASNAARGRKQRAKRKRYVDLAGYAACASELANPSAPVGVAQDDVSQPETPESDRAALLEHSGTFIYNVHDPKECAGRRCPIHHRSDHRMRTFPQHWRDDRKIMERLCPHGIGHPDPDSPWPSGSAMWVHGCCGCCRGDGPGAENIA